ncbi:hypothetical protein RCL_jg23722.t1 [Rhizophagus clarus]|uniref:Uncharacterized protein n=1 Tax=Rhizophagus clarus TaxID=94130 RepID=A0A8H3LPN2_9GLOM|nr:hypothetical protein RCL_jg23722.t1 [Rhizophagus clarus]
MLYYINLFSSIYLYPNKSFLSSEIINNKAILMFIYKKSVTMGKPCYPKKKFMNEDLEKNFMNQYLFFYKDLN